MNAYQILGVSRFDGREQIKSAYRSLAKTYHPDCGGDGTKILLINQAYNLLKKKRGL
jgi:curved DNA-binding protein CbpA